MDDCMTPYVDHALQIDFSVLKSTFLVTRPIFSGDATLHFQNSDKYT